MQLFCLKVKKVQIFADSLSCSKAVIETKKNALTTRKISQSEMVLKYYHATRKKEIGDQFLLRQSQLNLPYL